MATTNFPNGVSSFGIPVLSPGGDLPLSGQYFFVSSSTGADGNPGSWDLPKQTISGALGSCVANRGDVIALMPGFTKSITAAAGVALNVAGVTLVGLGNGSDRATITFTTATAATMTVTSANISVRNVLFDLTGFDAIVAPISPTAADFSLIGCDITTGNATNQAALAILTTTAANRLTVAGCTFHGTSDAGTAAAIRIVGGTGHQIINNVFIGAYTTSLGAIDNATTACTEAVVSGNLINNLTASSAKAMVFVATSTGMIANNRMQILTGTAPITGAAMSWVGGNYYAATIATAGTLI